MAAPSSASRAFLWPSVAAGPLAANCNRITTNRNPIISLMYYFLGSLSYLATLVHTTVVLGNILQIYEG
jgi:hypothetical protein